MDPLTSHDERRALLERMVAEQPHRLARKMRAAGHPRDDADDLAQETLVRALRSLDGLRGPADEALLCGWVDRIAVNLSLNARRSLAREPRTTPLPDGHVEDQLDPDEADLYACRRSLDPLLSILPAEQRTVFVARVLEERSTADVATELGIPADLVRWRLRTARHKLRDHIDSLGL